MKVKDVISVIESFAPAELQEEYDNAGLAVGNQAMEVSGILCTLDITHEVIDEALSKKANMIISHHPVIFKGIKSITGKNTIEEIIIRAIKNDLIIYSAHTNADNVSKGVNHKICELIGLGSFKILSPLQNKLLKLVTFAPLDHAERVRKALFDAGAGTIGDYDSCSFNAEGTGTFRGGDNANPFAGTKGNLHTEPETRIETILPVIYKSQVIRALINVHPYEEVAYDLISLENEWPTAGAGMIGEFPEPVSLYDLLKLLAAKFEAKGIRYAGNEEKSIKRIAVCGGSGSSLIHLAKQQKADAFITGDIKYHQFFDTDNDLIIIDIGHYESEQFTKDIFYELLKKKLSNFAVHLSEVKTNPIKYY